MIRPLKFIACLCILGGTAIAGIALSRWAVAPDKGFLLLGTAVTAIGVILGLRVIKLERSA